MKLATFTYNNRTSVGKLIGEELLDISLAFPDLPKTLRGILDIGETALATIREAGPRANCMVSVSKVTLEAPIQDPPKIMAIGMNYQKHVLEAEKVGVKAPDKQFWFNKQVSCVNGPYAPVHLPNVSKQLDYEAELAVVIGKRCKNVSIEDARSVIAGYMCINDLSIRDWQKHSPTFTIGKSFDTTGPMGPFLVTDDEIDDPHNLSIRCCVNNKIVQESITKNMIHSIYAQIAYLSSAFTLQPGDVIATGTPEGVGVAKDPPVFLKIDDVIRVDIGHIGFIENKVIAEPIQ